MISSSHAKPAAKWRFAIDRGGTFTDIVALDPEGNFHTLKLLSRSPSYRDASIEGIRRMLDLRVHDPLPEDKIAGIRFGTTLATNALLERKGGKVALLTTKGFADLLDIGYQNRPHIFKLCIKKPSPLYSVIVEVDERIDCEGRILKGLDTQALRQDIEELRRKDMDTIAVVLMHSWKNPLHEVFCEKLLNEYGFSSIILSHKTINLVKIVSRGQTTLVDAYLSTAIADYLGEIEKTTGDIPIEFMQSNGSLSAPSVFSGKDAILSGPAGGVNAVARIAEDIKVKGIIGLDMGGTSTDVSRFESEFEKVYERTIDGITLQTEMLNIVTVAAGGGSILNFDGRKMTVGPESAGSYPGPVSYGFGGPLTVTDANLLTGRLIPGSFPKTFGPERNASLDAAAAKEKFSVLTNEINAALGVSLGRLEVAEGFLRIANEKMARAIKEISVSKGFDVREYALLCFGGAGGQHACSIASLLDIDTIIIHPLGSVMSAYGIGLAQPAWKAEQTVLMPYNINTLKEIESTFEDMEKHLMEKERLCHPNLTTNEGIENLRTNREIDLRPKGAETFLTLKYMHFSETSKTFNARYEKLFGFSPSDTELEAVNLRLEIRESTEFFSPYRGKRQPGGTFAQTISSQDIFYEGSPL